MVGKSAGRLTRAAAVVVCGVVCGVALAATPVPWGTHGHVTAGRAAATDLPTDMPDFFRAAEDRLAYLNYEPDRWRDDNSTEMNEGFRYDHYVDLENVPDAARAAPDRFTRPVRRPIPMASAKGSPCLGISANRPSPVNAHPAVQLRFR